jgi:hypothetical protein
VRVSYGRVFAGKEDALAAVAPADTEMDTRARADDLKDLAELLRLARVMPVDDDDVSGTRLLAIDPLLLQCQPFLDETMLVPLGRSGNRDGTDCRCGQLLT